MSAVRRNEAHLNQLEAFLGIHAPELPQDSRSIQTLLDEFARPVEGERAVDPGYLHRWSGVFFGVSDSYLKSVAALMNTKEPWKPFLDFANNPNVSNVVSHRLDSTDSAPPFLSRNRLFLFTNFQSANEWSPTLAYTPGEIGVHAPETRPAVRFGELDIGRAFGVSLPARGQLWQCPRQPWRRDACLETRRSGRSSRATSPEWSAPRHERRA
jgi:hypothetical protein